VEPLPTENPDVVVEGRLAQKVACAVARTPSATFAAWPMDEPNDERLADQSLRHALRVIEDHTHAFGPIGLRNDLDRGSVRVVAVGPFAGRGKSLRGRKEQAPLLEIFPLPLGQAVLRNNGSPIRESGRV